MRSEVLYVTVLLVKLSFPNKIFMFRLMSLRDTSSASQPTAYSLKSSQLRWHTYPVSMTAVLLSRRKAVDCDHVEPGSFRRS